MTAPMDRGEAERIVRGVIGRFRAVYGRDPEGGNQQDQDALGKLVRPEELPAVFVVVAAMADALARGEPPETVGAWLSPGLRDFDA